MQQFLAKANTRSWNSSVHSDVPKSLTPTPVTSFTDWMLISSCWHSLLMNPISVFCEKMSSSKMRIVEDVEYVDRKDTLQPTAQVFCFLYLY